MLFSLLDLYNCIYILLFLGFKDTSFANFASTSHVFDNVRMLFIEILHPQPALSRPCGYSPSKFCICNPRKSIISDIFPNILCVLFTSQLSFSRRLSDLPLTSIPHAFPDIISFVSVHIISEIIKCKLTMFFSFYLALLLARITRFLTFIFTIIIFFDTGFISIVGTNCQKMARIVILWYTSNILGFLYLL